MLHGVLGYRPRSGSAGSGPSACPIFGGPSPFPGSSLKHKVVIGLQVDQVRVIDQ